MTIEDASDEAGVSPTTWGKVERGEEGVRRTTYSTVERVLGWESGSIELVLAGGEPVETSGAPRATGRPKRKDHIAAWEDQIIDEIWASALLSDQQKEDLTARARAKAAEARVIEDRLRRRSA